jgi:hypothetical protein
LVVLLGTLPILLGAVVAQFGVLMVVFQAIGPAVGALFNAKNVAELAAAVKGLSPAVKTFVIALLPLKQLLSDLKRIIVDNFFAGLGDNIRVLIGLLTPFLKSGLGNVALALGQFFHELIALLSGKEFQVFLTDVFDSTVRWITTFGPAFLVFLKGLLEAAHFLLPLLTDFGEEFSGLFEGLGRALSRFANDPDSKQFLKDTREMLHLTFLLLKVVGKFILSIINTLATSGGKEAIESIIRALEELMAFFESPVGQLALRGFIDLLIFLTEIFTMMIIVIGILGGIIGGVIDLLKFIALLAIYALYPIFEFFAWVGLKWNEFKEWIMALPGRIANFFISWTIRIRAAILGWLYGLDRRFRQIGEDLAQSLVDGFRGVIHKVAASGAIGFEVGKALTQGAGDYLPHSPAKKGVFSGSGAPAERGAAVIRQFAEGMETESRALGSVFNNTMGNINFGPGAVRVQYNGVNPTPDQARITGSAIGAGLADQMAMRNTRLAVRTL